MKNKCQGFILLETLILAVFTVVIFTFLYSSVIPLLGTYEDLTNKNNIDIVYKLYHVRKFFHNDDNFQTLTNDQFNRITSFTNDSSWQILISDQYLDLKDGYEIVYVKDINSELNNVLNWTGFKNLDETLRKYIKNYNDSSKENVIFLYDKKTDSVAHLEFVI